MCCHLFLLSRKVLFTSIPHCTNSTHVTHWGIPSFTILYDLQFNQIPCEITYSFFFSLNTPSTDFFDYWIICGQIVITLVLHNSWLISADCLANRWWVVWILVKKTATCWLVREVWPPLSIHTYADRDAWPSFWPWPVPTVLFKDPRDSQHAECRPFVVVHG